MIATKRKSQRGVALLLVIGFLALLAMILTGAVEMTETDFSAEIETNRRFRLLQVAEAGLALGAHPSIERGDPLLRQTTADGIRLEISTSAEQSRLNINTLLTSEAHSHILRNLLSDWGLGQSDSEQLIARMQDWTDPSESSRPGGATIRDYEQAGSPHRPAGRPFRSVDEIATVLGAGILDDLRPDWRSLFTTLGNGALNINEADPDLIMAVTGASENQVMAFISRRDGTDRTPGTDDDYVFSDFEEVRQSLGMGTEQFAAILPLLTMNEAPRRITSKASLQDSSRAITVIINPQNPSAVLLWKEE